MTGVLHTAMRPSGPQFRLLIACWLVVQMLLALSACGGGDTDSLLGRAQKIELEVVPAAADLPKGLTRSFKVFGIFPGERRVDVSGLARWQSSAPAVASVDAAGLVRALTEGSTVVTASYDEAGQILQASAKLQVTPPVVQSLTLAPEPAVSGVGLQLNLKATGIYSDGTTADVTALATWTSQSPAVVEVQPATGISVGVGLGTGAVRAAIGPVVATVGYSVVANTWTPGGDQPDRTGGATLLADGRVLSVGQLGHDPAAVYDMASRSWSNVAPYLECSGCSGGVQTLLASGLVLGTGGMNSDRGLVSFSVAKVLDPSSGRWTGVASMTQRRVGHSAIRLAGGSVLVVGGMAFFDALTPQPKTAEIFDPVSATWARTGSFTSAEGAGPLSLLPDGRVLMISGGNAELFDPAAGTWSPTGSPGRTNGTVTPLRDGKVLLSGGGTSDGSSLATAKVYDPSTGAWAETGSMAQRRNGHAATLLADGRVMVSGGRDGTVALASTEIYDPSSGAWTSGPPLLAARSHHSAVRLPNGVVAVMGGISGPPTTNLRSVELYW